MSQIVKIVQVVEAVQRAKRHIKPEDRGEFGATFFSRLDFWDYHAIFDTKLCPLCMKYAKIKVFAGSDIRGIFPDLEIVDVNTIKANVHPHCRCELHRKIKM